MPTVKINVVCVKSCNFSIFVKLYIHVANPHSKINLILMELSKQVCSLELAKRLKELGVKQVSLFYWVQHRQTAWPKPQLWFTGTIHDYNEESANAFKVDILYSAFTVAELGNLIHKAQHKAQGDSLLKAYGYVFNVANTKFITALGLNLCMEDPSIGAKMLIYLIENNLITND